MSKNTGNISYLLLGDLNNQTIAYESEYKKNSKVNEEAKKIFDRMCVMKENKIANVRNKIPNNDIEKTCYYFVISDKNKFVFAEANDMIAERQVFSLIDAIINDKIAYMINEKGVLNSEARQKLKTLKEKHQATTVIHQLATDVDDIKLDVKDAINKELQNMSDVKELEKKSKNIQEGAAIYKRDARDLKRVTCMRNCKLTIIIIAVIIVLILIIVLPIVLTSSAKAI